MNLNKISILLLAGFICQQAKATTIDVFALSSDPATKGIDQKIGTISFVDSDQGLKFTTDLEKLTPGDHGFHVHENPSCEGGMKEGKWVPGLAAGNHLDPEHTGHHLGPNKDGHLGDLPFITADSKGESKQNLIAKRLKESDLKGHAVIIHQGADTYSDTPPLGGGGDRIACGVIQ